MSKAKVFFILCLSFIVGLGLHSFFAPDERLGKPFWWYVGFLIFAGLGLAWLLQHRNILGVWCLGLGFFFLGFFRYAQSIPIIGNQHISRFIGQEVAVRVIVDSLPHQREKTTAYVIKIICDEPNPQCGKLLLTVPVYPAYHFGEGLFIKCIPEKLSQYEKWAVREGVNAACAFPSFVASYAVEVGTLAKNIKRTLYHLRGVFNERLRSLFSDPYGALLAGILYGDTSGISPQLREAFRITGLAHITALSGYNISIISWVLTGGLIWVGFTRRQALPVTLCLILAFVLATGAEASVVRAAIMGALAACAQGVGRLRYPRNALALAGAVMLAFNPRLLRFDLGFLLSFVATIALLYYAEDIARRTLIRKLPKIGEIRQAGAASVSALLFTTPLLLYHTGILGPFALLVNILVVPIVPAIMALGFLAVTLDFLWHSLGLGVSFLARVPLQYVVSIAEYFARFGALHIQLSFISASVLFCLVAWRMWQWKRQGSLTGNSRSFKSEL